MVRRRRDRANKNPTDTSNMLFVSGLPACVSGRAVKDLKREVRTVFTTAGFSNVVVKLGMNHEGQTRGWGYVTLKSASLAECLLNEINGGTSLSVRGVEVLVTPVSDKRDTLFPAFPAAVRSKLRLDSVAVYSTTDQYTAQRMSALLWTIVDPCIVQPGYIPIITDATACGGGNTLAFATQFSGVNAVEITPGRAADLQHNVSVCGLQHKVNVIEGDFTKLWRDGLHQDIVFIDPPWGGAQYRESTCINDLSLVPDVERRGADERSTTAEGTENTTTGAGGSDAATAPMGVEGGGDVTAAGSESSGVPVSEVAVEGNGQAEEKEGVKGGTRKVIAEVHDNLSVVQLCLRLRSVADMVAVKLPPNFDVSGFAALAVSSPALSSSPPPPPPVPSTSTRPTPVGCGGVEEGDGASSPLAAGSRIRSPLPVTPSATVLSSVTAAVTDAGGATEQVNEAATVPPCPSLTVVATASATPATAPAAGTVPPSPPPTGATTGTAAASASKPLHAEGAFDPPLESVDLRRSTTAAASTASSTPELFHQVDPAQSPLFISPNRWAAEQTAELLPDERPLPFMFTFGVTQLLVLCYPPRQSTAAVASTSSTNAGAPLPAVQVPVLPPPSPGSPPIPLGSDLDDGPPCLPRLHRLRFCLRRLDSIIANIVAWNDSHGQEHHPAFYDWEASRWIKLSRWKGCKLPPMVPSVGAF